MKCSKNQVALVATVIFVLSLALLPVASPVSPVQAAVPWTKYSGELSLKDGSLDELYVVDAYVIKDGTTYKMWYTHGKTTSSLTEIANDLIALNLGDIIDDIANLDLGALLTDIAGLNAADLLAFLDDISTVIGYATSSDGITWTVENSLALVGSGGSAWDSVGAPSVIKDDTAPPSERYKMWYTNGVTDLTEVSLGNILTDLGNIDPDIVKAAILDLLDSTNTVISYTTSPDGENWTVPTEVFNGGSGIFNSVGAPSVIKEDSTYKMWYTRAKTDLVEAALDDILANLGTFNISDLLNLLDGTSTVIGYTTSTNGTTWTAGTEVMAGSSGGLWDSVGAPSVVKTDGSYEMWYTNGTTDLTVLTLPDLLDAIILLDLPALWTTLETDGLLAFLTDFIALDISTIESLLSDTSTAIGYATSPDGATWTEEDPADLVGGSGTPLWSSVGNPSVIKDGTTYKMWYTKGIDTLTAQNLTDVLQGTILPIGYAFSAPPAPGGGGAGGPIPPGYTYPGDKIDWQGIVTETFTAPSADNKCSLTLNAGIKVLDQYGRPLKVIIILETEDLPPPPENRNIIGFACDFGPDGATFDPSAILTIVYDQSQIPEGVSEEKLVITTWDEAGEEWVELEGVVVDPVANTAAVPISHFTVFTMMARTAPAAFTISGLTISPAEVDVGESVTITALVANTGDLAGSYVITLTIDNVTVAAEEITLAGGTSQPVIFTTTKDAAGTYEVNINDLTGTFTVRAVRVPVFVPGNLTISPTEVTPGETVNISATIVNIGEGEGSYIVTLKINGVVEATREVTLAAGGETTITFAVLQNLPGSYLVEVNGLTGTFTVGAVRVPVFVPDNLTVSPTEVTPGETVNISATIVNIGEGEGSYIVTLKINGVVEATREITLAAGGETTITFAVSRDLPGSYIVEVNGLTGTVSVIELKPPPTNWWLIIGIITGVVLLLILIILLTRKVKEKAKQWPEKEPGEKVTEKAKALVSTAVGWIYYRQPFKTKEAKEMAKGGVEEAAIMAVREAKERARREAKEAKKAIEAERKARQEAEHAAKEKAKREAAEAKERARREAEEAKKAIEAEKKARLEAERVAGEKARLEAAEVRERAKREAKEAKKAIEAEREAEEKARREAEEAKKAIEAEREAEEKARREAEEAKKAIRQQPSNRLYVEMKEGGGVLTVTALAVEKLKEAIRTQTTDPEIGIRLMPSPSKPDQFEMTLDKEKEGDQVVESEGLKILLLRSELAPALEGMVIDCQETPQGVRFTISKHAPST